jgi:hypothetical protein
MRIVAEAGDAASTIIAVTPARTFQTRILAPPFLLHQGVQSFNFVSLVYRPRKKEAPKTLNLESAGT